MKTIQILLVLMIAGLISCKQEKQAFVSTDVDHFWEAYDKITSTNDTTLQAEYLEEYFINKGSQGLTSLMEVRRYTPKEYLDAINDYPKFWNSIRANTTQSESHHNEIGKGIAALRKIYPDLKPATIYFLMGIFRTNGTIQEDRVLIGSEMALSSKDVDISELPEHPKTFSTLHNPIEDIAFLCTHEYVHTQQKEMVDNLLSYCIYEGVAEFIASHVTKKKSYLSAIEFGETNYEKVRDKFEEDIFISYRVYNWLWSTNKIFEERDLGYAVGYGMAKRYYEQAKDKKKAIRDMIELDYSNESEVEQFVDASGYLSKPINQLYDEYEKTRPYVSKITGIENGDKAVSPGKKEISIHFSEPLNGYNTGVDFGNLGKAAFPKLEGERIWSEDGQSWTITAKLEANKQYQILISNNFRLENGIQLKPFLIEFWTKE